MKNLVILTGHLGQNPEVRTSQNGNVVTLNLATDDGYYSKTNEWISQTNWHRIVCFGKAAEAAEALKKGHKVTVFGSLTYSRYEKEGITHFSTNVKARQISHLVTQERQSFPQPKKYEDDSMPF